MSFEMQLEGTSLIVTLVVMGVVYLFMLISLWKIFSKAGEKGFKVLIPIYNFIVLLKIAGMKAWQIILFIIPGVNIVFEFLLNINLSKKFGKESGFGVLCTFFPVICLPILAFSKCTYTKNNEQTKEASILDVNQTGVPNDSEKKEFGYGYEKEPTVVMDPVNPNGPEQVPQNNEIKVDEIVNTPDIENIPEPEKKEGMLDASIPDPSEISLNNQNVEPAQNETPVPANVNVPEIGVQGDMPNLNNQNVAPTQNETPAPVNVNVPETGIQGEMPNLNNQSVAPTQNETPAPVNVNVPETGIQGDMPNLNNQSVEPVQNETTNASETEVQGVPSDLNNQTNSQDSNGDDFESIN